MPGSDSLRLDPEQRMNTETCQICEKNRATVHVIDVKTEKVAEGGGVLARSGAERHVCPLCAQNLFSIVVTVPAPLTQHPGFLKLLQIAQKPGLVCSDCGMTLTEFRSKGRLGCPKDYELFWPYVRPLLERVHNATSHVTDRGEQQEAQSESLLTDLRAKLATAIQQEAYEHAAELRDAIEELQKSPTSGE